MSKTLCAMAVIALVAASLGGCKPIKDTSAGSKTVPASNQAQ